MLLHGNLVKAVNRASLCEKFDIRAFFFSYSVVTILTDDKGRQERTITPRERSDIGELLAEYASASLSLRPTPASSLSDKFDRCLHLLRSLRRRRSTSPLKIFLQNNAFTPPPIIVVESPALFVPKIVCESSHSGRKTLRMLFSGFIGSQ